MKSTNQPDKNLAAKAIRNRTAPAISSSNAAQPAPTDSPGQHLETEVLAAFLEGQLPSVERDQALAHLAICPRCRQVIALSSTAADSEPTMQAVSPVPTRVEAATEQPEDAIPARPSRWKLLNFPVLAAVACAALVLLSLWLIPAFHRRNTPVALMRSRPSLDQHANSLASTALNSQSKVPFTTKLSTDNKLKSEAEPIASPQRRRHRHSRPTASQPFGPGSTTISSESLEASLKPQFQLSRRATSSRDQATRVSPLSLARPRLNPPRMNSEAPSPGPASAQLGTSVLPVVPTPLGISAARSFALSVSVRQETRKASSPPASQPVDVDSFMQALVAPVPLPDASVLDASPLTRPSQTAPASKSSGTRVTLAAPVPPLPPPAQSVPAPDPTINNRSSANEEPGPRPTASLNANPGSGPTLASHSGDSPPNAEVANDVVAGALERPLPNGANPLAAAAIGPLLLAIDSWGYLERSEDAGRSWKPIDPQWTGRLISLRVALPETTASGSNAPRQTSDFEIETVDHLLYRSSDGTNWHPVKK
jgi:hypothetical protein